MTIEHNSIGRRANKNGEYDLYFFPIRTMVPTCYPSLGVAAKILRAFLEVECQDPLSAQRHRPCGGKNRRVVHQVYHEVSGFPGPHFWGICLGAVGLKALILVPVVVIFGGL